MTALEPLLLDGVVPYPEEFAVRYRSEGHWTDQTLAEMLFEVVERVPDKTAIIADEVRITYGDLGERVLRFAAGFTDLGINRGDRVVLHLPNVSDYVPILFALFEIGAVPVLALAALRRHEIEYFVEFTEARAYVTIETHAGNDFAALARELEESSPNLEHTVVLATDGTSADVEQLLSHGALGHARRSLPSDVAFLQLSGGTTGQPKVIPHTHEDYLASVRASVKIGAITGDTVQLVVLPLCHSFAMRSPGFLGVLSQGGTIVPTLNGSPDVAFPLIAQHGVTDVSVVPPLALVWLNSSLKERYDLTSLQVLRVGGAKFSAQAAGRVRAELGATVQQSFGMAEGLTTFTGLDEDDDTITSRQGRPTLSADEVVVVDDEGTVVPTGTAGHLWTRGPSTIRGYYRAPEHNAQNFTADGFYKTGDIVLEDERGYLTVVGRSKDQINRGGEKIAPEEVENLLLAFDAVHDVSVVGVPDEMLGERTKAFVVPRAGGDTSLLTLGTIRKFLRDKGLAAYKLPDVVELVDEFERTAVGKVSKLNQRAK
ncbi:2,3-dihydroxybenzoate-AMP ligase [Williamsia limnetica]|uniref:2,3-dihydroxybenzoate-AMP ligase n=1 Tax=Williamsia limnetica TaxID=882452 RepID=A0A318S3F1_WILLI|nr:AMP-binding protein [Williamsia limnetica]PYE18177.1 2,3-dihydroxybenzoate-AMP ligase [Williamsia limnetica]